MSIFVRQFFVDMIKKFLIVLFSGLVLITGVVNTEAATIYVPGNDKDTQYKTIQDAIENALPGDTVLVKQGNYNENIVLAKPVTIKSDKGPGATIVKASNPSEPVFKVLNVSGAAIIGFTATGSKDSGIYLQNSNNGVIQNNKTIENRNGISLYSSNHNTLMDNVASKNELSGIYLELSNNNTLEKNTADSNKEKGIFLNTSNSNELVYNSASLNAWNGITLWSSNNNTVQGNKVLRNTYSIIQSNTKGNTLIDNTTWTNIYIILPIILIYAGILIYWIQRRIFRMIYTEKNV